MPDTDRITNRRVASTAITFKPTPSRRRWFERRRDNNLPNLPLLQRKQVLRHDRILTHI
jgi:hypothetical protein